MKALCIIPEGKSNKDCKIKGYPYEVTNIKYLEDMLAYANKNNLGILYLYYKDGILYSDDIIEYSKVPLYKFSKEKIEKWNLIITEQIFRECLKYGVDSVYIMNTSLYTCKDLINTIKSRGIKVYTPILGVLDKDTKKKLSI